MSTPEGDPEGPATRPGSGLWGGVWRRWGRAAASAPGRVQPAPEGTVSREGMQALIDRKRRNDLERRREFEFLRGLRRKQAAAGDAPSSAPSAQFPSSLSSSVGARATTLRKIDEIEAQMSAPWQRPPADAPHVPGLPLEPACPPARDPGASAGRADAVQVQAFVHDPELDEAALRFAQGDLDGARDALLALLAPGHPRAVLPETWRVLFDFYRATGQQERYEERASEFAARFACSPPQWRRLSDPTGEAAGGPDPAASVFPASALGEVPPHWSCPQVLDRPAVLGLGSLLTSLPQPWRLSWLALARIEPQALPELGALVARWVGQPLRLRFEGSARLEEAIEACLVRGDRQVAPEGWILHLDLLRALGRSDDFERVALDYCVTYEVSPPSWEPAQCDLRVQATAEESDAPACTQPACADPASEFAPPAVGELAGVLLGDPAAVLARLDARLRGAESVLISCARLERIDFEAAGALLNWVTARRAQGQAVHLQDLHRLVAVFLGAMGLGAQARLTLRND